jgi:hypothetical protein
MNEATQTAAVAAAGQGESVINVNVRTPIARQLQQHVILVLKNCGVNRVGSAACCTLVTEARQVSVEYSQRAPA